MKYICFANENGMSEILLFPRNIDHDVFAESVARMKDCTKGNWIRVNRDPISAGFVDASMNCHGSSITLDLDSRKEDTEILSRQLTQHG